MGTSRQLTVAGLFCAGEMLDWEAPTGGYLLTSLPSQRRACGRRVLAVLGCSA